MTKHLKRLAQSKTMTKVVLPIILVIILAIIGYTTLKKPTAKNLTMDEAKNTAETFINKFLMSGGNKATVKDISEEYDLYKLKIDIVSDVVESYITKDGKLFFPQALNIEDMNSQQANSTPTASTAVAPADLPKTDKPVVELFVMSHCPYGTQIEKGILPVVSLLGKKMDFQIKFVDYSMHGDQELKEQLNQYCINSTQPDKYYDYLKCFLVDGQTDSCLASTGINTSKVNSCVKTTDAKYKVTENAKNKIGYQGSYPGFDIYKDDNVKYGVAGSPTLVINGKTVQSGRDPETLLTTICAAFNNQPDECKTALSSETPNPGFGTGTSANGGSAAAACN